MLQLPGHRYTWLVYTHSSFFNSTSISLLLLVFSAIHTILVHLLHAIQIIHDFGFSIATKPNILEIIKFGQINIFDELLLLHHYTIQHTMLKHMMLFILSFYIFISCFMLHVSYYIHILWTKRLYFGSLFLYFWLHWWNVDVWWCSRYASYTHSLLYHWKFIKH